MKDRSPYDADTFRHQVFMGTALLHVADVQPVFHDRPGQEISRLRPVSPCFLCRVEVSSQRHRLRERRSVMWRVAIYGHEEPGDRCRARLDRQVLALASHVARQSDWCHVATYADIWPSARNDRPGLLRLVGDAGPVFDLVVIEGYQRLALRRRDQRQITQQLAAARAALMVPSSPIGRRIAATVLNVALADLVCESAR